jgi:hypothetical protein
MAEAIFDWVRELPVKEDTELLRLFTKDRRIFEEFEELVAQVPTVETPVAAPERTLVAGRGLDLSGDLDCRAWKCRQKQVDQVFRRMWHYFDRVVIVGAHQTELPPDLETEDNFFAADAVASDLRLMMYLVEIGAADIVELRHKAPPCTVHVAEHANEAGIPDALTAVDDLTPTLAAEADMDYNRHDDHFHYALTHPLFEHTIWGVAFPKNPRITADAKIRDAIARSAVERHLAYLSSDVAAARQLGCPLGSTIRLHQHMLGAPVALADPVPAALYQLELPVLDNIDVATLLELRASEQEHFDRFRDSLRTAVRSRIEAAPDADTHTIAREVQEDVIEPALNDIRLRLKTAEAALNRKRKLPTAVGALLTGCGVLSGQPLLVAAGLSTCAPLFSAAARFEDDRREVELSEMYFLWRASGHAAGASHR